MKKLPNIFYRKNRILLKELVKTDFKLRYQGSVLGYLWALIKPLMMFTVLYIVFVNFLRIGGDIPHYAVYLLAGVILWSFFVESTNQGIQAIIVRSDLIRKISFPKYIIVTSATITALINLCINLCVLVVFALINGVALSISWLLVPILVVELYALSLGIAFLLGAINVRYRDISSIWEVIIQAAFYATPIIYPLTMISVHSEIAAKALLLNPVAQIVQDIRYALVTKETITIWSFVDTPLLQFVPIIIVLIVMILAALFFRKRSKRFAEEV